MQYKKPDRSIIFPTIVAKIWRRFAWRMPSCKYIYAYALLADEDPICFQAFWTLVVIEEPLICKLACVCRKVVRAEGPLQVPILALFLDKSHIDSSGIYPGPWGMLALAEHISSRYYEVHMGSWSIKPLKNLELEQSPLMPRFFAWLAEKVILNPWKIWSSRILRKRFPSPLRCTRPQVPAVSVKDLELNIDKPPMGG